MINYNIPEWMLVSVIFALAIFSGACEFGQASENQKTIKSWAPSTIQIDNIEKKLTLPKHARQLDDYVRFYAGKIDAGQHHIIGLFVVAELIDANPELRPATQRVRILEEQYFPEFYDGGCDVINFEAIIEEQRIVKLFCNGGA